MQLKKTDLAWAAGFIDGEGCITISNKQNKSRNTITPSLKLSASQLNPKPLKTLKFLFGGSLSPFVRKKSKNKGYTWESNGYEWGCQGKDAIKALKVMYNFLQVKQEEAKIALKIQNLMPGSGKRLTKKQRNLRLKLAKQLQIRKERYKNVLD